MKQTTRLRRLGPWLSVKRIKKIKKTHLGPIRRASGVVWALFPLRGPVLAFVDLRWPSLAVVGGGGGGWKPTYETNDASASFGAVVVSKTDKKN